MATFRGLAGRWRPWPQVHRYDYRPLAGAGEARSGALLAEAKRPQGTGFRLQASDFRFRSQYPVPPFLLSGSVFQVPGSAVFSPRLPATKLIFLYRRAC